VKQVLRQPWARSHRIHFFIGSPLQRRDLARVRAGDASMVYVLADFETQDTRGEDQRNVSRRRRRRRRRRRLFASFALVESKG
jgi:hypothetical protein